MKYKNYNIVTLDFETYWSKDFTLSKLATSAYVRDPRFKVHMMGIQHADDRVEVCVSDRAIREALSEVDWTKTALLAQNCAFDGFILTQHYGITPAYYLDTLSMARALFPHLASHSLEALAKYLCLPGKIEGRLNETKGIEDLPDDMVDRLAEYCEQDVELCVKIFRDALAPSMPEPEMDLVDLTIRMFCEPVLEIDIDKADEVFKSEVIAKDKAVRTAVTPDNIRGAMLNDTSVEQHIKDTVMSNPKFAAALQALDVDPPTKISPTTGTRTWAFAKTDPGFKELLTHQNEAVRNLAQARLRLKSTLNETRAKRFVDEGRSGKFPVGLKYYGAHCVPGDTEVLTPDGWRRIDKWQGGDIAQVTANQSVVFEPATRFIGPECTDWVDIDATYLKGLFTLGHVMPYLKHDSFAWGTIQAADAIDRASLYIPTSGRLLSSGAITATQMRLLVMIQADGSYETQASVGRRLAVFVKKPRKIKRARELLAAADIPFEEQTYPSHPGFVRFIIRLRNYPTWLSPERKFFGPWLLDSTEEAREAFFDEIPFWDGWSGGGQEHYTTSDYVNAEWVQTLAHLTKRSVAISSRPAVGNRRTNYDLSIRRRAHCLVQRKHVTLSHTTPEKTYCTKTKTGFWLARRDGHIFITGNTGRWSGTNKINLQNLPRGGELRRSLLAPKGYAVVVADSAQIEARMTAWLAGETALLDAFRNGRDVYAEFASIVYNRPINKDNDPTERFVGKTCLAEGSLVLCDRGWVPIEAVTINDKLWDGKEWVCHKGVISNGLKPILQLCGLWLTPDHLVWSGTQWLEAQFLLRNESSLFQALATAAASLPLPDMSLAPITGYPLSSSAAHAAAPNTQSTEPTQMATTSRVTYDLCRKKTIYETNEKLEISRQKLPVYDIVSAGPRNRFTTLSKAGPLIVHNCTLGLGYGTGAPKLQTTLKSGAGGPVVDLPLSMCYTLVNTYRSVYSQIPALWKHMDRMIKFMAGAGEGNSYTGKPPTELVFEDILCFKRGHVILPNDMAMVYPNLYIEELGTNARYKDPKGAWIDLYGAKLVENMVQALARIVVAEQMLRISKELRVVTMSHDEVVSIAKESEAEAALKFMLDTMKTPPTWAPDLPLAAEGDFDVCYSK